MATISRSTTALTTHGSVGSVATWSGMARGDDGAPIGDPGRTWMTIQVDGTIASGDLVQIQGSNDGTNWYVLLDSEGAPVEFANVGLRQCNRSSLYVRPFITGSGATADVTVTLVSVRG